MLPLPHIFSNFPLQSFSHFVETMLVVTTFTDNKHFGLAMKPKEAEGEIQRSAEWVKPPPPSIGPFTMATEQLRKPVPC
jgi:hypothetical protein